MKHLYDPQFLNTSSYKNDQALNKRKSIYDFLVPRIDLTASIISHINLTSVERVLDVGCGAGGLLIRLKQEKGLNPRCELYGIDIAEGMLEKARGQSEAGKLSINFQLASADQLPFPDSYFDVIICQHVLYHVADVQKAVEEAYRCLNDGGQYLVTLNSQFSKTKLFALRNMLAKKLKVESLQLQERFNIENFEPYFKSFSNLRLVKFEGEIRLENPEPYVDYIDSVRDNYDQTFSDEAWRSALAEVRKVIEDELRTNGVFTDSHLGGLFIATK